MPLMKLPVSATPNVIPQVNSPLIFLTGFLKELPNVLTASQITTQAAQCPHGDPPASLKPHLTSDWTGLGCCSQNAGPGSCPWGRFTSWCLGRVLVAITGTVTMSDATPGRTVMRGKAELSAKRVPFNYLQILTAEVYLSSVKSKGWLIIFPCVLGREVLKTTVTLIPRLHVPSPSRDGSSSPFNVAARRKK